MGWSPTDPTRAAAGGACHHDVMDAAELAALIASCSNWGRWGRDDERGTLNLITPEVRLRAAGLVREGVSVSLATDLTLDASQRSDALRERRPYDHAGGLAVGDTITL